MKSRFSVTMWEFSWLLRRTGDEAEYRDWDQVLDELCERGYNCIRIDAFPHLIAAGADGTRPDRFTVLPQNPRFPWGNHRPVEVQPLVGLVEFMFKARERGLSIGLSTWFNDDTLHRRAEIRTPADYTRIWTETLELLDGEGLLDCVVWVDLCNEFPLGLWAHGAYRGIFGTHPLNVPRMMRPWSRRARGAVQRFYDQAIPPLKMRWPELDFTFSVQHIGGAEVRRLDTAAWDLAEPHVWLSEGGLFQPLSNQLGALLCLPGAIPVQARIAPPLFHARRTSWLRELEKRLDRWAHWAQDRGLPLVTSEGWGPINYDDVSSHGREWGWVKDVCGEAVQMAIDRSWTGICTSNFAQPHFKGMWRDVGWHREMTDLIRG